MLRFRLIPPHISYTEPANIDWQVVCMREGSGQCHVVLSGDIEWVMRWCQDMGPLAVPY